MGQLKITQNDIDIINKNANLELTLKEVREYAKKYKLPEATILHIADVYKEDKALDFAIVDYISMSEQNEDLDELYYGGIQWY